MQRWIIRNKYPSLRYVTPAFARRSLLKSLNNYFFPPRQILLLILTSETMSSSGDIRAQKLGEVFNKVTDASVNSISEIDLSASFNVDCGNGRTLKDIYGSNLQKLFFNFITKTQSNIVSTFQDISIRHSVDDLIAHIDALHFEEETSRLQKQVLHFANVLVFITYVCAICLVSTG